jgi:hypothetical protein
LAGGLFGRPGRILAHLEPHASHTRVAGDIDGHRFRRVQWLLKVVEHHPPSDSDIDTGDPSFGVTTNGFGFTITASNDLTIVVEASDRSGGPEWVPVGPNALTAGTSFSNDPQWRGFERRFYRLRSP